MQDKELESVLQKKADEIELRDFSEIWKEIKDQVTSPEQERKKKKSFYKNFSIICASVLVAVCITLVSIKLFMPVPEEVFFSDDLARQEVVLDDMLDGLSQGKVTHVDLSRYVLTDCKLLVTEKNVAKGAIFSFYNVNPTTFFANMFIYDKKVDLDLNLEKSYDSTCKVKNSDVYYKSNGFNGSTYDYSVYVVYNNVQYLIEYQGLTDNLTEFLNEFLT